MERIIKLKDFIAANPGDPFLRHALALEYIKTGDDEQAQHLFEGILANDPMYIGSYYHLAKLLERKGETESALQWYRKGMEQARLAGDNHALNELRSAHDELAE